MPKYYKKELEVVTAVQYTGTNLTDILRELGMYIESNDSLDLTIETFAVELQVKVGDYVIKGSRGEIYVCDGDSFLDKFIDVDCVSTLKDIDEQTVTAAIGQGIINAHKGWL